MPLIDTEDGEYLFAIDDYNDTRNGRRQWVVYRGDRVVLDRHSYEAAHGTTPPNPPPPDPALLPPDPHRPAVGAPRVIQVTDASDGGIRPRMMSDRANAFLQDGAAFVFCGTDAGPRLFKVDIASRHVERRGPIGAYGGETEGWYWMQNGRIIVPHGPQLLNVDPFNSGDAQVVLDISRTHPGHDLWQPHSSDDGRTHSATIRRIVESGRYPYVGTIINGPHGQRYERAVGQLDESQVTRDGSHVVIKQNGEDNRIINLATGDAWDLADADGAIGHSDCGDGFIVGESNLPGPGRCVKLDLHTRERITLFETDNMGYVSTRAGKCLWSNDTHISLVALDGSVVTPLIEHGADVRPNDPGYYDRRPKANLSPCGRVATYMVNGAIRLLEIP